MESLISFFNQYWLTIVAIILAGFSLLLSILKDPSLRLRFVRLFRFMFYIEPQSSLRNAGEVFSELEDRINALETEISQGLLKNKQSVISNAVDTYIKESLDLKISTMLDDDKLVQNVLLGKLQKRADSQIQEYLSGLQTDALVQGAEQAEAINNRISDTQALDAVIESQNRSASTLRKVMINLFVIFNLGVISTYIFAGDILDGKALYGIIGVYLSLALFIVYIYRTSNARSLVLLAIREDAKKRHDVFAYLQKIAAGRALGEYDIELLRLIGVNRSERERTPKHPYEIILKGIENSSISLQGGRISAQKNPANRVKGN